MLAIFGIDNDGLSLAVTLVVLMFVAVYFALIVWTYLDAKRRIDDGVLLGCATAAACLFPFIGAAVYSILRPPEFLEDARERELEIRAAELRVRQLSELSCPNCMYPIEKSYLRCPTCQRRLKDPCQGCGKPVDPRWAMCPYCERPLPGRQQRGSRRPPGEGKGKREEAETRKQRPAPRGGREQRDSRGGREDGGREDREQRDSRGGRRQRREKERAEASGRKPRGGPGEQR